MCFVNRHKCMSNWVRVRAPARGASFTTHSFAQNLLVSPETRAFQSAAATACVRVKPAHLAA